MQEEGLLVAGPSFFPNIFPLTPFIRIDIPYARVLPQFVTDHIEAADRLLYFGERRKAKELGKKGMKDKNK